MYNNNLVIFIPTILEAKKILNIQTFSNQNGFTSSNYKNIPLIVTGATKTNAAFTSALFYSKYNPKYSLLTGICGAYQNTNINIGDIVSIKYDYFVDEANFNGTEITTLEEKGFSITTNNRAEFLVEKEYKEVLSNTVSLIPQLDNMSQIYQEKTGAVVENMEGASFGMAANKFNHTPYQIRAVSNFCGDINKQNWNIKLACSNLKNAIDNFITNYKI